MGNPEDPKLEVVERGQWLDFVFGEYVTLTVSRPEYDAIRAHLLEGAVEVEVYDEVTGRHPVFYRRVSRWN